MQSSSRASQSVVVFKVGQVIIDPIFVFLTRKYVFAMVSPKAVTQGHVLVYPIRSAQNLSCLSELEMLEMFICA